MKKLTFLFGILFVSMSAFAQYSPTETVSQNVPIDIRGSRVFLNSEKLDKMSAANCFSSLNGIDKSAEYLKYRAGYKTGLGLTFGGLSLAAVGFVATTSSFIVALPKAFGKKDTRLEDAIIYTGVGSMFAGAACFLAGVPLACVYKVRLNRLEKEYNASLQLQASSNGLGLAFSF